MTAWYLEPGGTATHGFSDGAWMRSLCGGFRWTVALEPAPAYPRRCSACLVLDGEPTVTRVDNRERQRDAADRRRAFASAARRRWRRTT